jgi:hypothetical protein
MSAGCFLETMAQGATLFGYEAVVDLFPEGYSSGLDFGNKPVVKVALKKTDSQSSPLARYITRRQTSRVAYTVDMLTNSEFLGLETLSGNRHGQLIFFNKDPGGFFYVLCKAFEIESRTYATNEKTRQWFRFSEAERREKRDGLSVPQGGMSGLIKVFAEASLKGGDEKTWHGEKSVEGSLKNFKKGLEDAKGIVIWKTKTNGFGDWVQSGIDYAKFSLSAAKRCYTRTPTTR